MKAKTVNQTSFEVQIQNKRKLRRKRFIVRLSLVGTIFFLVLVYLFSPLSQVRKIKLSGNLNLNEEQIMEICNLSSSTNLYLIDKSKCEELLNSHPLILSSNVDVSPLGLSIVIDEITPVFRYHNLHYLNNGDILDQDLLNSNYLSDYLNNIIEENPILLSESEKLEKDDIVTYSKIFFNISKEARNKFEFIRFSENHQEFSFFYPYRDYYIEIVLSLPGQIRNYQDISYAIDEESLIRYRNNIFDDPTKFDDLTIKTYESSNVSFNYYTIKVIISYTFGSNNVDYKVISSNTSI